MNLFLEPEYLRYRITDPARRQKLQEKCYRLRWNDEALARLAKNNGVSLDFVLEHLRVERQR